MGVLLDDQDEHTRRFHHRFERRWPVFEGKGEESPEPAVSREAPGNGDNPGGGELTAMHGDPDETLAPSNGADDEKRRTCPVVPMGHRQGRYYFLTPSGELRDVDGGRLNGNVLTSIFDGDQSWLFKQFGKIDDGRVVGLKDRVAAAWLMKQCASEGLFDPAMPMRGPGVWRDGRGGLVVHCGDALLIDGKWCPPGAKRGDILYPAAPRIAHPSPVAVGHEAGERLLDSLRLWNFKDDVGPDLITGFIGAALLGAAPRWRAHIMVLAELGSGKSWLAELVSAALGGAAHPVTNNFTEAGLRQALTGEARAIILDEAEHDEGGGRVLRVIELLRHMSGGGGARVMRGSAGGTPQGFTVNGCVYLSSILAGVLKPQDRSRITVVQLDRLSEGLDANGRTEQARLAIEEVSKLSAGLRARAIADFPRFAQMFENCRGAFLHAGCSPREADQLATFAAGRDLLLYDEVPESAALEAEVERFAPLVEAAREEQESGEGHECLRHLLSSPIDFWRSGEKRSLAQMILNALEPAGTADRRDLASLGLKLVRRDKAGGWIPWSGGSVGDAHLVVANRHQMLESFYRGSRWAGGSHTQALRYLAGAEPWRGPAPRFDGVQSRATIVPPQHLPRGDDEPEDPENG